MISNINYMEKKSIIEQEVFSSEEENTLSWEEVQSSFEKNFGTEVYSSWLKNISLLKEYNDYLVLGVPTRFFRDWIVSRYLDKIVSQLKTFKNSIIRVEFKILEEHKINSTDAFKIDDFNKVTEIKDSILIILFLDQAMKSHYPLQKKSVNKCPDIIRFIYMEELD
jgi:chromosomal replication initiation ATPase DnaA